MQSINLNNNPNSKESKIPSVDEIKELLLVKYKRVTIMAFIIIFLIAVMSIVFGKYADSEANAQLQYNKYVNSLYADKNVESQKTPTQVILPAEGTVDMDKINGDIKTAETTLKQLFTFSNGEEYDANRDTIIKMFGETSEVATSVFTMNDKVNVDGQQFNYVDINEVNMKATEILTYPIEIRDDGYNRYLSCVSFNIVSKDKANVNYMLSVLYDMDEYGSMIECEVYILRSKYD